MTLLRSALLTGAAVAFCGLAAAQLVPGGKPVPPPPPPPAPTPEAVPVAPPPPPPAAAGALVNTVSMNDIKAIFTEAGVPFEIAKTSKGREYLVGKPNGWMMFVYVMECANEAALSDCSALLLESGTFVKKASLDFVNGYNLKNVLSHAVLVEGNETFTKQVITLNSGVSPTYLRDSFRFFTNEMVFYSSELDKLGAPGTGGGTFSSGNGLPQKTQITSPAGHAEDIGTAGHAEGGAFGK